MLEFLYDAWKEIAGISGFIMLVINLIKLKNGDEKKKSFAISLITFVLALFCIAALLTGLSFTKIPNVRGKTLAEAEQILDDHHLSPTLQSGYLNNKKTYDRIVENQNYAVGALVPRKTQVTLYFGTDPEIYKASLTEVPYVVGMKYAEATKLIEEQKLKYSIKFADPSVPNIEKLYVVDQALTQGMEVPEGSTMEIVVSTNSTEEPASSEVEYIVTPYVVGMAHDKATRILLDTGFVNVTSNILGNLEPEAGYVFAQSIPADTKVPRGSSIDLTTIAVEIGSSVVVPDVLGKEQNEAVALLQESGLRFQVEWAVTDPNAKGDVLYVKHQSIAAGSTVQAGTIVLLSLVTIDAI